MKNNSKRQWFEEVLIEVDGDLRALNPANSIDARIIELLAERHDPTNDELTGVINLFDASLELDTPFNLSTLA